MENITTDQLLKNTSLSKALSYLIAKVKSDLVDLRSHANKYYEVYLGMRCGGDATHTLPRAQINYQFVQHYGPLFVAPLKNGSLVLSADLNEFILQVRNANNQTRPHLEQDSGFSMYYTGTLEGDDVYVGFNDDTMILEVYDKDCKRKVFRIQKNIEDAFNFTSYTEHVLLGLLIHYFHTGLMVVSCEDTEFQVLKEDLIIVE